MFHLRCVRYLALRPGALAPRTIGFSKLSWLALISTFVECKSQFRLTCIILHTDSRLSSPARKEASMTDQGRAIAGSLAQIAYYGIVFTHHIAGGQGYEVVTHGNHLISPTDSRANLIDGQRATKRDDLIDGPIRTIQTRRYQAVRRVDTWLDQAIPFDSHSRKSSSLASKCMASSVLKPAPQNKPYFFAML